MGDYTYAYGSYSTVGRLLLLVLRHEQESVLGGVRAWSAREWLRVLDAITALRRRMGEM
jgi:hypothetical protein